MHKGPRRKELRLDDKAALSILENGSYGVLSTADRNSQPYGVPLNYALYKNTVYIHCAYTGHKIDNIKTNDKVSFCVVGKSEIIPEKLSTNYESVVIFGRASIIEDDEKITALRALVGKYSPEYVKSGEKCITDSLKKTAVITICIDHMTGKHSK